MRPKKRTNEFSEKRTKSTISNFSPYEITYKKGIVSVRSTLFCYLSRACGFLPRSHFKAISACHSLPRIINHLGDSGIILNKEYHITLYTRIYCAIMSNTSTRSNSLLPTPYLQLKYQPYS